MFQFSLPTGRLLLFTAVMVLLNCTAAMAQGNLMITPRRVVFEGQQKTQELNLANTGKDTARYVISMIEIKMNEDGSFEQITVPDSGQNFASAYVRFFPRSVILGPGEVQTVKVQVTKQGQLVPGEYRSHIYFRAIPRETALTDVQPAEDSSGISVRLIPVFGISIPVIIRTGVSTTAVNISDTKLETSPTGIPLLNMTFNRTGNMSVYGDITIQYISKQGKVTKAAEIKGMAVYTPTAGRRVKIALDKTVGIDYRSGKIHILYTTSAEAKPVKMAEAELVL